MNETAPKQCEHKVDLDGLSPTDWCNSLFKRVARENACATCGQTCEESNEYKNKEP